MQRPAFIATGVPQLDQILGGGIVPGALMLIAGSAGSGKTVLAAQIAWAIAARNERVLLVTAFSEPHDKLIANLRNFSFFNQSYIGGRVKLLNLQQQLSSSTGEAADTIVREARDHKAQLVILDGFQGVRVVSNSVAAPHQFLYDLSTKLNLLGVTGIVTFDYRVVGEAAPPELTAVDSIVALAQELVGDQAIRTLQVVKHRGASPLLGRHSFQIGNAGVTCYPRQESVAEQLDVAPSEGRVAFGVPALDHLLNGGLPAGTTTIIAGGEGVGKTLLGLHFVKQAVADGEAVACVSFHETPQQLVARAQLFGFDLQPALDSGLLRLTHTGPAELNPDKVGYELRTLVREAGVRRLIIDGINEIERPLIERNRAHGFFVSLLGSLRSSGVTTCITVELDPVLGRDLTSVGKNLSALADNVVLMRHTEASSHLAHTLVVLKMRFSHHDRQEHRYTIGSSGIELISD